MGRWTDVQKYSMVGMTQTNGSRPLVVLKTQVRPLRNFRSFLKVCGVCILSDGVWKPYALLVTAHTVFALVVLVYSAYFFLDDMESLAVVIHHSMLVIDVLVSTVYFFFKRTVVRRLVSDMRYSYNYDSPIVSEFLQDLEEKRIKNMSLAFKCLVSIAVYMQINLIIFGALERYTREGTEFMLIFPCWFPFDLSYLPNHVLAYLWEHVVMEMVGLTIFGVMALIFLVYSHLTTQLALLIFAIQESKTRASELTGAGRASLRDCYILGSKMSAEHHLQIIDYYNAAHGVFRVVYLMVFVTGLVVCTCTGFALISDNASLKIKFVGVTMIQLVVLYVVCWFGEKIAHQSEGIRLAIYGTEWYDMPRECRSTFRLMAERTLRPMGFTTLTGQKVDLDNFMSMIKASYSYFNMMLASQEKQSS